MKTIPMQETALTATHTKQATGSKLKSREELVQGLDLSRTQLQTDKGYL
ncbi:unnamed protein product [Acanthoscelides obtectus]|uniref:Uncharacterized protein n=1 Tax=Acanthoscelides obtectus TaxID=200917 RepID=A0A9P0K9J5_ACAOB|nr:unnamed protein product [Acanthoscelides obtectus]CAK1631049.1 hypothetical protein AOBTE_LOCUS6727 [Acanthoscelides obtectus]